MMVGTLHEVRLTEEYGGLGFSVYSPGCSRVQKVLECRVLDLSRV